MVKTTERVIVHISEVPISQQGGMGRIEYYWKESFEKKGYKFIHIGPADVGPLLHKGLFPYKAYNYYKKLNIKAFAFIVHEPASGVFSNRGIPCFIESHGIERRHWDLTLHGVSTMKAEHVSWKTKMLFPIWRLWNCDKGLKNADKLMLSNSDDSDYVQKVYKRNEKDILIFKNGINEFKIVDEPKTSSDFNILFNASWIERKGIHVLINAAKILHKKELKVQYILIGTGIDEQTVLSDWPEYLLPYVKVIPRFEAKDETNLLAETSVFVLPSFFEGQPLSLVQAMAVGKCCITTNCCGQKDLIINEENGFLFEVGDFVALAELIQKCYHNQPMIQEIGSKAKLFVKDRTWEKVSNEVTDYIIKHSEHKS